MKKVLLCFMTIAIPVLLVLTVLQAGRFGHLQKELRDYRQKEDELITGNAKKISAIAILMSPARIEKIAIEDLGMKKALASEIIRVSLEPNYDGGIEKNGETRE
ncbi:MAG: cell division protein FtsL [Spirochaetaceae bacterium]|nr:cell division protein FtsL [Spirochaetaceae bacterium]